MATKIETHRTPKMLKDFLQDNNNSSSSTGFKSYPRTITTRPEHYYQASVISTLPRSRSKSRAAAEALGKLLNNAVKAFHSSNSTPLTLHRSVSRRFLGFGMNMRKLYNHKKKKEKLRCSNDSDVMNGKIVVVSVKVKDILRWRSFRDLVSDKHDHNNHDDDGVFDVVDELQPLDLSVGSIDEEVNKMSEDFTVTVSEEELPCWSVGEKWDEDEVVVASDTHVGPKKDDENMASEEELEQQSPVSVLESPFRDEVSDQEFHSSFDQSLANMERTKQRLLQSIQLFESLAGVHEDEYELEDEEEEEDEYEQREVDNGNEGKSKGYLSRGLCWFRRGGKGLEEKLECIKGMDEQRHWGKFEDERVELGNELEVRVLSDLLDEVLIDFCG